MTRRLALTIFVAFTSGYVSLSYEILWYRTFAYVTWSTSAIFPFLLAAFLLGIAMGSRRAKALVKPEGDRSLYLARLAWLLLAANAVSFFVVPLLGFAAKVDWRPVLVLVVVGAGLMGAVLRVLAQFGIDPDTRAGWNLSLVYIGNIAGSALGSLLTGFVVMDAFPTRTIAIGLAVLGFLAALGVAVLTPGDPGKRVRLRLAPMAAIGIALAIALQGVLFGTLYERLLCKRAYAGEKFKYVVENRHGVIAVGHDDTIYGGGAYDGAFNVNLAGNPNNVHRTYAIEALRSRDPSAPAQREMLMIGLSSGSWARIIADLPSTKSLRIIEINPGYLELIRKYPSVASILDDPKVTIEIDDGRRWLLRHPDAKFDFIVMNASFSWRAHMTNLLSVEFLELVRAHLRPWGIHYFNTTWSLDVMRTAVATFPQSMRVMNFAAVSDAPFVFEPDAWERLLASRLDLDHDRAMLDELLAFGRSAYAPEPALRNRLETGESLRGRLLPGPVVTDDNMLPEVSETFVLPDSVTEH